VVPKSKRDVYCLVPQLYFRYWWESWVKGCAERTGKPASPLIVTPGTFGFRLNWQNLREARAAKGVTCCGRTGGRLIGEML
jgi:hypothetical protein